MKPDRSWFFVLRSSFLREGASRIFGESAAPHMGVAAAVSAAEPAARGTRAATRNRNRFASQADAEARVPPVSTAPRAAHLAAPYSPWPPVHTKNQERRTRNGFTLIEVTLAVVVIGMGLLTLFGLGQLALSNAKAMEDDTRSAMLAEDIFASLRTVSENLCDSNNPAAWIGFWSDFADGQTPLPINLSVASSFSNQFDNTVWGDGRTCTNDLWSIPANRGLTNAIPEWSARYWMDIALTNLLAASDTNLVRVTLHIVPGFTGEPGEARSFYTHFTEHGTLP